MIVISDLTKYGAILAKVSVMKRGLLTRSDYLALIQKHTVAEAAAFLKNETAYGSVLTGVNENDIHRGELERLMGESYMEDAIKLYRFDNNENKRFYTYVYIKAEIELLKHILRRLNNEEHSDRAYAAPDFFLRHFTIRPERLLASRSIKEFLENLSGSRYESVISPLLSLKEHQNLSSVEMTLDMYYYSLVEKLRQELTDKEDQEVVTMTVGSEIDALNLLWIYRCKNYFRMPPELIYSLLIPNQYKLSKSDVISFVESRGTEEFLDKVRGTSYRSLFSNAAGGFYDRNYASFVYALHKRAVKQYPYSIEAAVSYLHFKDIEIRNVTSVIEGIRYGLAPEDIMPFIVGTDLRNVSGETGS